MRKTILLIFALLLFVMPGCKPALDDSVKSTELSYSTVTAALTSEEPAKTKLTQEPVISSGKEEQKGNIINDDGSVKIDVYVNDKLMNVKVFGISDPNIAGPDNFSSDILADPIMDFLDIKYTISNKQDAIKFSSNKYGEREFLYSTNQKADALNATVINEKFMMIDGKLYLPFWVFRVYTDGSFKQDDYNSMYLYTGGYERKDIPATLEECYAMLDEMLNPEDIQRFKDATEEDLALQYQMGLGLWMRNNWLYPTQSKLAKLLFDNGVKSIDSMSGLILNGYIKHLNGQPSLLQDMLE